MHDGCTRAEKAADQRAGTCDGSSLHARGSPAAPPVSAARPLYVLTALDARVRLEAAVETAVRFAVREALADAVKRSGAAC